MHAFNERRKPARIVWKEATMYIGVGTLVVILLIVLIFVLLRDSTI
jgi:hypothetical protein